MFQNLLNLLHINSFALYVTAVEAPARRQIKSASSALEQWQPSFKRAAALQSAVSILSCGLGVAEYLIRPDIKVAIASGLMIFNMPYTLIAIMPTNRLLLGTDPSIADEKVTRSLINHWEQLHFPRTIFGIVSTSLLLLSVASQLKR